MKVAAFLWALVVITANGAASAAEESDSVVSVDTTQMTTTEPVPFNVYHQVVTNIAEKISSPIYEFLGISKKKTDQQPTARSWSSRDSKVLDGMNPFDNNTFFARVKGKVSYSKKRSLHTPENQTVSASESQVKKTKRGLGSEQNNTFLFDLSKDSVRDNIVYAHSSDSISDNRQEASQDSSISNNQQDASQDSSHSYNQQEAFQDSSNTNYQQESSQDSSNTNYQQEASQDSSNTNYQQEAFQDSSNTNYQQEAFQDSPNTNYQQEASQDSSNTNYQQEAFQDSSNTNYQQEAFQDSSNTNYQQEASQDSSNTNYQQEAFQDSSNTNNQQGVPQNHARFPNYHKDNRTGKEIEYEIWKPPHNPRYDGIGGVSRLYFDYFPYWIKVASRKTINWVKEIKNNIKSAKSGMSESHL